MLLYRFQPINKFSIENLILKKNWSSNPAQFNDPFEFPLQSAVSITKDGRIVSLSAKELQIWRGVERALSKLGVVSYSIRHNNTLLWSHYAHNHTGMCLAFEVNDSSQIHKVKYVKAIPKQSFKSTSGHFKVLVAKSTAWKYENEYRQIFPESGCHQPFPGDLREVIFGCQASYRDIQIIMEIVDKGYDTAIQFSKMFVHKNSLDLGKSEIQRNRGDKPPLFWQTSSYLESNEPRSRGFAIRDHNQYFGSHEQKGSVHIIGCAHRLRGKRS